MSLQARRGVAGPIVAWAAAVLLCALGRCPHALEAKAGPLEAVFASRYADDAWREIEKRRKKVDPATAEELFTAGLAAAHGHLAIGIGDALRDVGAAWITGPSFKKALKRALRSKDIGRRRNLARILGAWGHPLVDAPLATCATAPRPAEVMEEALYMCGMVVPSAKATFPKTAKAITRGLKSKIPEIRMAACAAAGRRGLTDVADTLAHLVISDLSRWTGLYAVRALEHMERAKDIDHFAAVIKRSQKAIARNACLKAVATLACPRDLETLETVIRSRDEASRLAALAGINRVFGQRWFKGMKEPPADLLAVPVRVHHKLTAALIKVVLHDESQATREAACLALIRMGPFAQKWVAEEFPHRVTDREPQTRLLAMKICIAFELTAARPALYGLACDGSSPAERLLAARALNVMNPAKAAAELAERVGPARKPTPATLQILEAMGSLRHRRTIDVLVGMLAGKPYPKPCRIVIEEALERLTGHRFGPEASAWRAWLEAEKDPFPPAVASFDRGALRAKVVGKALYGIRMETERAMEYGLQWLERQQDIGGSWLSAEHGWGGVPRNHASYTAQSLLAFLGAGYRTESGRYREVVWRAAEFLAAAQRFDGVTPDVEVASRYDADLPVSFRLAAREALIDASASGFIPTLRAPAQMALDALACRQLPGDGWGRTASKSMASLTSLCVVGLARAESAGLQVFPWMLDGPDRLLRLCSSDVSPEVELLSARSTKHDANVSARRSFLARVGPYHLSSTERADKGPPSDSVATEVGLLARLFMGYERTHPLVIGGATGLGQDLPNWPKGGRTRRVSFHSSWVEGGHFLFQVGGPLWRRWRTATRSGLVRTQRRGQLDESGSWKADLTRNESSDIETTVQACRMLQCYYMYPPLYER